MTAAALTSGHDAWPDRPSLTPSHSKTPASPGPGSHRPHAATTAECGRSQPGPLKSDFCPGPGPSRRPRIPGHARREPQEPDSYHRGLAGWSWVWPAGSTGPLGMGWRSGPKQTLSPASPAQEAWQRGEWAVTAKSDASQGAAPSRPSIGPARAVVLTSLIQLTTVAMNLRLHHRRSLRAIERNLAGSDPSLAKLFSTFTVLSQGEERGRAENVRSRPLRALARRLATALEFDPADPWRRSK
jgi:hypothetical protein